jgi:hypothetical protein
LPWEAVAVYLDFFLVGVVVTIEEEKSLNERFKSEMPEAFWKKGEEYYLDRFARYKLCGIKIGQVQRIPFGKRIWRGGVGRRKVRRQWEPLADTQMPVGAGRVDEKAAEDREAARKADVPPPKRLRGS